MERAAVDAGVNGFISTFVGHAAHVMGPRADRAALIATLESTLAQAISSAKDRSAESEGAWQRVYFTVWRIVRASRLTHANASGLRYLDAFLHENADLMPGHR